MRRVLALAVSAPLILVGAALPDSAGQQAEAAAPAAPVTYRPCRPGTNDDQCIQLYERGVRASYARWLRDRGATASQARLAMGGPAERPRRPRRAASDPCVDAPGGEARGM